VTQIREVLICVALVLACPVRAPGQVHAKFEGWCDSLEHASDTDLVAFLNGALPDENNARCITWAIHRLGEEHYEPAIQPLVKLLDFRQPRSENLFHGPEDPFPSRVALEQIGKKALPAVLQAIKAESTSDAARDNAVAVWMEIYKYDRPDGIAALKQEELKADNEATKNRLAAAVQKALPHCGRQDASACRQAAAEPDK
jgi:hypothetical protein